MLFRQRLGLGVAMAALFTAPLWPHALRAEAPASPLDERARALVHLLGDPSYPARQRAARDLIEIGRAVAPYLEEGAGHSDFEVRLQCERLLADLDRLEFQRQLEAFTAPGAPREADLPGWRVFRDRFGEGARQRALFVEMQRRERRLLADFEANPAKAGESLAARCARLSAESQIFRQEPPLGAVAALLFLAGQESVAINDQVDASVGSFCSGKAVASALSGGEASLVRRLFGEWVRRDSGSATAYFKLTLALQHEVPEGLDLALALLKKPQQSPQARQSAIMAIARFGTLEHAPVLEPLLSDESICARRFAVQQGRQRSYTTQVRDVALVALIELHKQSPDTFGVETAPGFENAALLRQGMLRMSQFGFEDDEKRAAAFDKWRQWAKQSRSVAAAKGK